MATEHDSTGSEGAGAQDEGRAPSSGRPPGAEGSPGGSARQEAVGALGDALGVLLGALLRRGREELGRAAVQTRVRLDIRQLRRDRDAMYQKLGREVRSLIEGGELDHPGLRRGVERIRELEARLADVEAGASEPFAPPDDKVS